MGILDMFPEAAGAIQIGTRVLDVLKGMLESTDIKQRWRDTGEVKVKFTVNERYTVNVGVVDTQAKILTAEVINDTE